MKVKEGGVMTTTEIQELERMLEWLENPMWLTLFVIMMIWSLVWKGLALYRAANNQHKGWFVTLLIVNTVGLLEIAYLFTKGKK